MEKDKLFDEQILDMINQSQQKNDKNNIDEGKEQNKKKEKDNWNTCLQQKRAAYRGKKSVYSHKTGSGQEWKNTKRVAG